MRHPVVERTKRGVFENLDCEVSGGLSSSAAIDVPFRLKEAGTIVSMIRSKHDKRDVVVSGRLSGYIKPTNYKMLLNALKTGYGRSMPYPEPRGSGFMFGGATTSDIHGGVPTRQNISMRR